MSFSITSAGTSGLVGYYMKSLIAIKKKRYSSNQTKFKHKCEQCKSEKPYLFLHDHTNFLWRIIRTSYLLFSWSQSPCQLVAIMPCCDNDPSELDYNNEFSITAQWERQSHNYFTSTVDFFDGPWNRFTTISSQYIAAILKWKYLITNKSY